MFLFLFLPNKAGWAVRASTAPMRARTVVVWVQAMSLLDLVMQPKLVSDAKDYFVNVQTKTTKYRPLMAPTDQPATWLNEKIMVRSRSGAENIELPVTHGPYGFNGLFA